MSRGRENPGIALLRIAGVLLLLAGLHLGRELLTDADRYAAIPSPARTVVQLLRGLSVAAALGAAGLAASRWRRIRDAVGGGGAAGPALRFLAYLFLPSMVAGSIAYASGLKAEMFAVRSIFFSTYLLGAALWIALIAAAPQRLLRAPRGAVRVVEIVSANVLAFLVLAEGAVRLYGHWFPSALLWNEASVASRIEANRLPPGAPIFAFPANQGGYHDEEFFRAEQDDLVVALLADSFGLGVVPYEYNFATVAERLLQEQLPERRVAIHNLGVGAIGMAEYAWLLDNEVEAWDPSVIVLSVFVGNDIHGFGGVKQRLYCVQNLHLSRLLGRLLRVGAEGGGAGTLSHGTSPPTEGRVPPEFVLDPEKEVPRFGEATYLEVERRRMDVAHAGAAGTERDWEGFFAALGAIRDRAGDRLRVVIIPDEFQVNDALWDHLLEGMNDADEYERDLPQARIVDYGREHDIPTLDLLPALRAGQRERRVYHLRDTHWNAAGNAIAGRELAAFLLDHLPPR